MSHKSKIEWTDTTWNPTRGCSRVSEGCRNCYAEKVANRFKGPGQPYEGLIASGGQWNGKITIAENLIDAPRKWKKPRRIFVNSMSDLFHENLDFADIHRIFLTMQHCPQHTFQVLTKRPKRMIEFFNWWGDEAKKNFAKEMPNVHLGTSVEDQITANERIPWLMDTPAAVRWISAEPLLGAIDLTRIVYPAFEPKTDLHPYVAYDTLRGHMIGPDDIGLPKLNWVVVGGESGPSARPMHPDWVRSLRDQCVSAGTAFFFKQWGEWLPDIQNPDIRGPSGSSQAIRVGKKRAGRLLDGVEWNQFPGAL